MLQHSTLFIKSEVRDQKPEVGVNGLNPGVTRLLSSRESILAEAAFIFMEPWW